MNQHLETPASRTPDSIRNQEASLEELLQMTQDLITDGIQQSEVSIETENSKKKEARGFFEQALLKRYGIVDVPEYIKNIDSIGEKALAEGLARVYGIDIRTLRSKRDNTIELIQ